MALDEGHGLDMAKKVIGSGEAYERFKAMVRAQGGDVSVIDHPDLLPDAAQAETISAGKSGWVSQVHARLIGEAAVLLGAGRSKKGDAIDHSVGIQVFVKVGDRVEAGMPVCKVFAADPDRLAEGVRSVKAAITLLDSPVDPLPLVYGIVKQQE
jgi:pyrimidine-nucleoside phosphorylase